ncbi:MAG: aldehyde ferredoxin oxidoreductase [Gammaproteobacteria bacterium]|nr:aldehyde ferredoxin oxidoreductase [Gammaproteobacteria bacterium]
MKRQDDTNSNSSTLSIERRVESLLQRFDGAPCYETQGETLFVNLANRRVDRSRLPREAVDTFLGGRGLNMYLLYNLMDENRPALDPDNPLIFGTGVLTGYTTAAARANVSGLSPDSNALLDTNAGDWFPAYMRLHGIDHIVLFGLNENLVLIEIDGDQVIFHDAECWRGLDNMEFTKAVEEHFGVRERRDMALARITSAGENKVLCSGIMAGPKAIWARGGAGAKMGALNVKGIMIRGKPEKPELNDDFRTVNRTLGRKITASSVVKHALKTVGTPFLYKPSRVLCAIGALNNQKTSWTDNLDADNFDRYRTGMDGCLKCPVHCRPLNDMKPGAKGGWGAGALIGRKGNASYDSQQSNLEHEEGVQYQGAAGDGSFDNYDAGDGPEYVTLGKFGPGIGIESPQQVLRLNNILNDLGLDSSSTGGAIAWAMELFQRGIIDIDDTGGLDLKWGNYAAVEKLLFMTARRQGFGDVIADSARAVDTGKYPREALAWRMAVKGLFQSDPHDSRILKAFALGLAVATRGMDHLRNRVTMEINARINDDEAFKTELYGGKVAARPNDYEGKEYAVRRCEDTFAVGDAVGMCRFDTKLFNSPTLPGCEEFADHLRTLTGLDFSADDLLQIGRNITGLERMINARRGLGAADDTLPQRWFDEPVDAGPFTGEFIDRDRFDAIKQRFYDITGLDSDGLPQTKWRQQLQEKTTGFAISLTLPAEWKPKHCVPDQTTRSLPELRQWIEGRFPECRDELADVSLNFAVNGELVIENQESVVLRSGDDVTLVPAVAGG